MISEDLHTNSVDRRPQPPTDKNSGLCSHPRSLILVSVSVPTDRSYLDLKSLKGLNSLYSKFNILEAIYRSTLWDKQIGSDKKAMTIGVHSRSIFKLHLWELLLRRRIGFQRLKLFQRRPKSANKKRPKFAWARGWAAAETLISPHI